MRRVRVIVVAAVVGAVVAPACSSEPEVDAGPAEAAFVECAAEFGVDVEHVSISSGDFDVRVADDAPREAVSRVQQECEPLALQVLADAGGAGADAGSTDLPQLPDGVDTVEGYVEHLRDERFAGVVLIERGGRTRLSQAFGLAERDEERANTVETVFDVASIAKTFTAAAVLRLVDEGSVAVDDTLGELMDDVPADKRTITVGQLLDFRSGLAEYHDTQGDFEPMTRDQARREILDQTLRFEPGTQTAYSNSSYTLAALVVEEVTGRAFTDVVGDLFEDAGLTRTGFYGSAALQGLPVAAGYEGEQHGVQNDPAAWEATWALLGAGGIASTAADLQRWWHQLHGAELLSADARAFLFDHALPAQTIEGVTFRGVGGTNDFGFDALIAHVPDRDLLTVVLSNANPPDRTLATEAGFLLTQLVLDEQGS